MLPNLLLRIAHNHLIHFTIITTEMTRNVPILVSMTMYIHHKSTFLPDTQATLSYKEACTHSLSASPSMAAMHTLTLCLTLNGCHVHTHYLPHPQWLPCTHSLSASPSMAAMYTLTLCLTLNGCHVHTHYLPHPQWLPCTHSLSASPSMAAMYTLTLCLTLNGCHVHTHS